MSAITTHVLDIARGKPASNVPVVLELESAGEWKEIGRGKTDEDGRLKDLLPADCRLTAGRYPLAFWSSPYFFSQNNQRFFPMVVVEFILTDAAPHHYFPPLAHRYRH